MSSGKILDSKIRANITFPKELKIKLEKLAKKDCRSFNSIVIKILNDYVESAGK